MPGLIAGWALVLFFWSIFEQDSVLPLAFWRVSPAGWAFGIFLSYLLGHVIQALGNLTLKAADDRTMSDKANPIIAHAKELAAAVCKTDLENVKDEDYIWLWRVMDEFCIQHGRVGDREIFTYREGFYRGTTISAALLGAALLLRMSVGAANVRIADTNFYVSRCELIAVFALASLLAWASYRRFRHFSKYRVARAIAAFIALSTPIHKKVGDDAANA
jgi:hypothetical protein